MKKPNHLYILKPNPPTPPEETLYKETILKDLTNYDEISIDELLDLAKSEKPEDIFIRNEYDYDYTHLNLIKKEEYLNPNYDEQMKNYEIALKKYNDDLDRYNNRKILKLEHDKKVKEYEIWQLNQKIKKESK